ncbi:uncharacterized protein BXZ73DRAFT_80879 [Epithele typhae]|uniref:uncharacterized protein n=1 Tax=Epithele typhae TaxID=378194 RepID=UPI0020079362|nr:uncharacterized protein BXZ73DRAFT_80879 [Epithele typhae]KAH9917118.1 hypothetical protein BXZ73DRAFT_80879 [Epithele typhae]
MPNPSIVISEGSPQYEADPDDFSRRLKISSSSPRGPHARPAANGSPGKLYDPNTDSVRKTAPHVTAEPDAMSDAASSSHSPRVSRMHQSSQAARNLVEHRQLFDPRKHDAVQFSAQNRHNATVTPLPSGRPTPTPKSSGDWVSASSTSSASYAHSSISSKFTLSSATDSSSASSALFDSSNPAGQRSEDSASSANAFSRKLKEVYRTISGLETRLLGSDKDRDRAEDARIRAPAQFLNYAYVFYGGLIEERNFAQYRGPFLEALGDMSRYWTAVSALIEGTDSTGNTLTVSAVAKNNLLASNTPRPSSPNPPATDLPSAAVLPTPAQIDDSPQSSEAEMPLGADDAVGAVLHIHNIPSIGQEAARLMELDPDQERWWQVSKDWFARRLTIAPNSAKLHMRTKGQE